jgi:hypothetical protein
MRPKGWFNYLDHETRIRTRMTTNNRGVIEKFMLQLEVLLDEEWLPIVRYDNAHGEAHIDFIDPSGVTYDKVWLGLRSPYNTAFTRAEDELKELAGEHRERFFRQMERKRS